MFELGPEIVNNYLKRRLKDTEDIEKAVASGEWDVIERIGHQIKGNGAMFGFPELAPVGKGLEEAAQGHDHEAVGKNLAGLKAWLVTRQ